MGERSAAPPPDSFDSDKPSACRLLLVEDDPSFVYLCKRYLRSDKQFEYITISAGSIAEATAMLHVDKFECLVVDYKLPDGLGTDLVAQMNQLFGELVPPTIVITAEKGKEAPLDALRRGACDFLNKEDMTAAALCRSVRNAVEMGRLKLANLERLRDLEIANDLLRTRNAEIQRFYHTVSHEVKTPLTAIQEFVSIVFDGLAGEIQQEQKTILNYALESCDQIKNQFDDLLELSRFETGKLSVKLEACSIYEVFDHCVVAATPAASEKGISLTIADQPNYPMVMMQRNRIIQVLSNLINNAIRFTDRGGQVNINSDLTEDGNHLKLSVSDTGCGIPLADQKHVFERLYQVTPSSDSDGYSGLGLGLSIAAEIIRLHGSHISLSSVVDQGSEFSFELAVAQTSAVEHPLDQVA